jgi:hypothetical protein
MTPIIEILNKNETPFVPTNTIMDVLNESLQFNYSKKIFK